MKQLVLASNNKGKIAEFTKLFGDIGIEIIPQSKLNVPEIDEPYFTFIENALHKARHCSQITNLPSLADDSGLCVNSLGGQPGVFSARFAGIPTNDLNNNVKLIKELQPYTDRSAFYYCILVMVRSFDDPQPIIADGTLHGKIIDTPLGENGFGYDPYFYLPKFEMTVGQLTKDTKNTISHRAQATKTLLEKINSLKY